MRVSTTFAVRAGAVVAAAVFIFGQANVYADPVDATYTATRNVLGPPNSWTIDFTVTSNLTGNDYIYFFDAELPSTGVISGPPNSTPPPTSDWAYASYDNPWSDVRIGGSRIVYNDPIVDGYDESFTSGVTLSGFDVLYTGATAPASLNYMVVYDGTDPDGGLQSYNNNYVFEGVANLQASAPEGGSSTMYLLLAVAVCGAVLLFRSRPAAVRVR